MDCKLNARMLPESSSGTGKLSTLSEAFRHLNRCKTSLDEAAGKGSGCSLTLAVSKSAGKILVVKVPGGRVIETSEVEMYKSTSIT